MLTTPAASAKQQPDSRLQTTIEVHVRGIKTVTEIRRVDSGLFLMTMKANDCIVFEQRIGCPSDFGCIFDKDKYTVRLHYDSPRKPIESTTRQEMN